jgi:hypothetical protein
MRTSVFVMRDRGKGPENSRFRPQQAQHAERDGSEFQSQLPGHFRPFSPSDLLAGLQLSRIDAHQ